MRSFSVLFMLLFSATLFASEVDFTGDVGVRHEVIDDATAVNQTTKQRFRVRLNATTQVSDDTAVGIGLASGGTNARSTNQTAGDNFSTKDIMLDSAYLKSKVLGADVTMGKFKSPISTLSELTWDSDLRPEGVAVETGYKRFVLKGAYYILADIAVNDPALVVGQVGYSGNNFVLTGSYTTTQRVATPESYVNVSSADRLGKLNVFGEYNVNVETGTADQAWIAGVGFDMGKLRVKYAYRNVEANGVNALLTDSDFGNGVDVQGSEINVGYTYKSVDLGVTYFVIENGLTTATDYDRLMVDASVKF